jgi:hypothetical protein
VGVVGDFYNLPSMKENHMQKEIKKNKKNPHGGGGELNSLTTAL